MEADSGHISLDASIFPMLQAQIRDAGRSSINSAISFDSELDLQSVGSELIPIVDDSHVQPLLKAHDQCMKFPLGHSGEEQFYSRTTAKLCHSQAVEPFTFPSSCAAVLIKSKSAADSVGDENAHLLSQKWIPDSEDSFSACSGSLDTYKGLGGLAPLAEIHSGKDQRSGDTAQTSDDSGPNTLVAGQNEDGLPVDLMPVESNQPCEFQLTHNSDVKTQSEKKYQCSVCGKSFSQARYLPKHMMIHMGERPFKCSMCDKSFITSSNLNVHMRTHTDEKPYQCCVCNDSFLIKETLVVHMRRHTGEKPITCQLCGKSYHDSSSLTRHMKTHTGEKPYKCSLCDKAFAVKQCRDEHVLRHTDKKPFKCTTCGVGFSFSTALYKHRKRNVCENLNPEKLAYDKPLQCSLCGTRFAYTKTLEGHLRKKICQKRDRQNPTQGNQSEMKDDTT